MRDCFSRSYSSTDSQHRISEDSSFSKLAACTEPTCTEPTDKNLEHDNTGHASDSTGTTQPKWRTASLLAGLCLAETQSSHWSSSSSSSKNSHTFLWSRLAARCIGHTDSTDETFSSISQSVLHISSQHHETYTRWCKQLCHCSIVADSNLESRCPNISSCYTGRWQSTVPSLTQELGQQTASSPLSRAEDKHRWWISSATSYGKRNSNGHAAWLKLEKWHADV